MNGVDRRRKWREKKGREPRKSFVEKRRPLVGVPCVAAPGSVLLARHRSAEGVESDGRGAHSRPVCLAGEGGGLGTWEQKGSCTSLLTSRSLQRSQPCGIMRLRLPTCAAVYGGPNVVARERPRRLPGPLPRSPLPEQWTTSAVRQSRATLSVPWAPPHLYGGEVHAAHTGPQSPPSAYL